MSHLFRFKPNAFMKSNNIVTGFQFKTCCIDCVNFPSYIPYKEIYCSVTCEEAPDFARPDLLDAAYMSNVYLCGMCAIYFENGRKEPFGTYLDIIVKSHLIDICKEISLQYIMTEEVSIESRLANGEIALFI